MLERIVVGSDGSDTAWIAVQESIGLAKATGARLDIVTAYHPKMGKVLSDAERADVPGDVNWETGPHQEVNLILDRAAGEAEKAGVETNTHPREGEPADVLIEVAEKTGADVIVVGNKGMSGTSRFLLGSVPNKVSHHAPCDVYIVRTT